MKARRRALTLIELLIVISIILILATIGIENYLLASVRSKVSRVKAEHRTLETAIETYNVDNNAYPRMAHAGFHDDPEFDYIGGVRVAGVMSKVLSTPVAYMENPFILDPFMDGIDSAPLDERLYTYQTIPVYIEKNPNSTFWPAALEFYGRWRLGSVGPDRVFDHGFANSAQLPYDPTNGTLSDGNIWTSPNRNRGIPTVPTLLGRHD